MTTPSQPTHVPPVLPTAPAPQESESVAKVATVLVRAKSGTKKFLTCFAAPVATGALTGLLVSRRNRSENDDDVSLDVPSDYTNE